MNNSSVGIVMLKTTTETQKNQHLKNQQLTQKEVYNFLHPNSVNVI